MDKKFIITVLTGFAMLSAMPAVASAAGISFGGRVASIIPCVSPLGPSLQVTIIPAGIFPTTYIWTPATAILPPFGKPTHPGQQLLGIADIPFTCVIPSPFLFVPAVPLFGLRMQLLGTSIL